ncbi:hypothetical protein AVEN_183808-1 [Araneus ventricosus]|uniref:Uncharacterized protein n=1 Tax=Araneus ventricosus TaxID=182803 RepID=A0A4Y2IDN6_ARAVE|nr:hypothetical protein AVEN_183808-1 [Araneus ventricosus]
MKNSDYSCNLKHVAYSYGSDSRSITIKKMPFIATAMLVLYSYFEVNFPGSLKMSMSNMEQEGYFVTDHVILNRGQMTRTTAELAAASPSFPTTPEGGHLTPYV